LKAACGSGCDARRLSTGRSIRAWRTLRGRQMARNAGQTLASEALVPWLGGPRSRGRSKRSLRSRRRVGRIAGQGCRPPPPVVQERRERAAKARRNRRGFCAPSAPSCHGDNARYPIRAFCSGARRDKGYTRPALAISRQKYDNTRHCATVGLGGRIRAMSRRSSGFLRPLDRAPLQGPR
jgi:hypothetical protein